MCQTISLAVTVTKEVIAPGEEIVWHVTSLFELCASVIFG